MSWINQDEWRVAEPDPVALFAAGTVAHMNADHAESLMVRHCKAFSKATDMTSATT